MQILIRLGWDAQMIVEESQFKQIVQLLESVTWVEDQYIDKEGYGRVYELKQKKFDISNITGERLMTREAIQSLKNQFAQGAENDV